MHLIAMTSVFDDKPQRSHTSHQPRPTILSLLTRNWRRTLFVAVALCGSPLQVLAAPTIGGATIAGTPPANMQILPADKMPLVGSLAIHGADAMTWTEYSFWVDTYNALLSNAAVTVLQDIYNRPSSRTNFPLYLLNDEIVTRLLQNLADTPPSDAAVQFWTARLNTYANDPQPSLQPLAKGRVMYDMYGALLSQAGTDPVSTRFNNRLTAAVVLKKETDTAAERNDQTATSTVISSVSRARLLAISDSTASYNAALAPLARLNWILDQSAIASAATYDGETGILTVTGTDLLSLAGPDNDIDPTKLTLYGDDSAYALTTAPAEITSATSFQLRLNAADRIALRSRLNRDGATSTGNAKYLLAASPGWSAALAASQPQPALTGTRMTVLNSVPAILDIDRSDAATAYDPATDGVLLLRYLLGQRGSGLIANARATGANLRDATQVENHLAAQLSLLDVDGDGQTLALTDGVMILRRLLNPGAATGDAAAMSAITAGAKRGTRTDAEIVAAIDALKP